MAIPLKLGSIEQQHLQELYEAAGVPRDDLPYTPALAQVCRDFQDRTFKNADHEQVYAAMIKYVRSSGNASTQLPPGTLNDDQLKHLKPVLSRHNVGGKILPYSDEFEALRKEILPDFDPKSLVPPADAPAPVAAGGEAR